MDFTTLLDYSIANGKDKDVYKNITKSIFGCWMDHHASYPIFPNTALIQVLYSWSSSSINYNNTGTKFNETTNIPEI